MSAWGGVRLVVTTLTVLPLPASKRELDRNDAAWAMALAPLVGAVVAAVVTLLAWIAVVHASAPPLVTAAASIVLLAALTRGMHLDGLADVFDGLGSYRDRDRALAIMKSPEVGPMGVMAIVSIMLLDTTCLASLMSTRCWIAMGAALVAGRIAITACCERGLPAARPDGLGAFVAETLPRGLWLVWAVPIAVLLAWRYGATVGLAAIPVIVVVALVRFQARRRFGGMTGDVLGAASELGTAAALLALVVALS